MSKGNKSEGESQKKKIEMEIVEIEVKGCKYEKKDLPLTACF